MSKVRYAIGSFENGYTVTMIGFKYKSEKHLAKKLKRAEGYGWFYDGLSPFRDVEELPEYIKIRF